MWGMDGGDGRENLTFYLSKKCEPAFFFKEKFEVRELLFYFSYMIQDQLMHLFERIHVTRFFLYETQKTAVFGINA